jgi:hypothetical protein
MGWPTTDPEVPPVMTVVVDMRVDPAAGPAPFLVGLPAAEAIWGMPSRTTSAVAAVTLTALAIRIDGRRLLLPTR